MKLISMALHGSNESTQTFVLFGGALSGLLVVVRPLEGLLLLLLES
jgi:hypothetical protein